MLTPAGTTPAGAISLFGFGTTAHWDGLVYAFSLSNGATLSRNYVPCIRKTDSVAGMYDTVNGTFTLNAGTGRFIAGPYINAEAWTPAELAPVSWWKLDGNGLDSVGTRDMALIGPPAVTSGVCGSAITTSATKYGTFTPANISGQFSLSFWCKDNQTTTNYRVIFSSNPVGAFMNRSLIPSMEVNYGAGLKQFAIPALNSNWRHYVLISDGTLSRLYIDGVESTSGALAIASPSLSLFSVLGTYQSGSQYYWGGSVDDVLIFQRTLTPTEITKLYNESIYRGGAAWPLSITNSSSSLSSISSDSSVSSSVSSQSSQSSESSSYSSSSSTSSSSTSSESSLSSLSSLSSSSLSSQSSSSSSISSSSQSSNITGHWVLFEFRFSCADHIDHGFGHGYELSCSVVYEGDTKHDHAEKEWYEIYSESRFSVGWESLLFFADPLHEHSGEYYFGNYQVPLPVASEGLCPDAEIDQISPRLPPSGDKMLDFNRDRFSGYNLPTEKLADGFEYYVVGVHPYFKNQPIFWQKPAFQVGFDTVGGNVQPIYTSPKSVVDPKEETPNSPNLPL